MTSSSSSNYTVTAHGGGLVCSARWTTVLKIVVTGDTSVAGTATSTLDGTPSCTHPEFFPTPVRTMSSTATGTITTAELRLQLNSASSLPANAIDATGMSASIHGIGTPPATITIPITKPGHAEGGQHLQAVTGANSYTSENRIVLDCASC